MSPHVQLMLVAMGVPLVGSLILYYAWRRPGVVFGGLATAFCAAFTLIHTSHASGTPSMWVVALVWAGGLVATILVIRDIDSLPPGDNIP